MAVTQQDIAKKLGISRVLVSYALNGNPRVSEETRRLVQQTAQQLGYRPNQAARALVTGRTGQIALSFFSQSSSFANELSRRFQLPAQKDSYDLLVSNIEALQHPAIPPAVDGTICFGLVPELLVKQGFPAVSLQVDLRGRSAGEIGCYDVIQVALEDASHQAVKHLLEEGCHRIGFVSVPSLMGAYDPRYRAYSVVMKESGGVMEKIPVPLTNHLHLRQQVQQTLRNYFKTHGVPDALFCSCDDIAVGAYRALRELGRSIPYETAVIGCDDIEEAQDHRPALSSIQWPFDTVCERAWQMLMERIANPSMPPRTEQFKAQFVPRASSQRRSMRASTPLALEPGIFSQQ